MVEERALRASRSHLPLDATHAVRVVEMGGAHRAEWVTAAGDDWVRSTPGDGAGLAVLHRLGNRTAVEDGFRVTTSARIAPEIDPSAVVAWVRLVQGHFLAGYLEQIDHSGYEPLMPAFDVEQVCRELVYAARHLPRWVYVPAAALAAPYRAG